MSNASQAEIAMFGISALMRHADQSSPVVRSAKMVMEGLADVCSDESLRLMYEADEVGTLAEACICRASRLGCVIPEGARERAARKVASVLIAFRCSMRHENADTIMNGGSYLFANEVHDVPVRLRDGKAFIGDDGSAQDVSFVDDRARLAGESWMVFSCVL